MGVVTKLKKPVKGVTLNPLGDRIVVRRSAVGEKVGSIYLPDTAQERPNQGEVVAVGPGARDEKGRLIPIDLRVGDVVLFGKYSGGDVIIEGDKLVVMRESDVLGVIS